MCLNQFGLLIPLAFLMTTALCWLSVNHAYVLLLVDDLTGQSVLPVNDLLKLQICRQNDCVCWYGFLCLAIDCFAAVQSLFACSLLLRYASVSLWLVLERWLLMRSLWGGRCMLVCVKCMCMIFVSITSDIITVTAHTNTRTYLDWHDAIPSAAHHSQLQLQLHPAARPVFQYQSTNVISLSTTACSSHSNVAWCCCCIHTTHHCSCWACESLSHSFLLYFIAVFYCFNSITWVPAVTAA